MKKDIQHGSNTKLIIISVFISITTTVSKYSYGFGMRREHLTQLPIISRVLDSNYLINDFYVNEAAISIARFGYAHFIAVLTLITGSINYLPHIYFIITLLSNIAIAVVTFLFARKIFNGSNFSGIFSVALVMTVSTFSLGYISEVYTTTAIPSTIARPLVFTAIYVAFAKDRLLLSVFLCGIASLFQPLYGLLFGGLVFASFTTTAIITKRIKHLEIQKNLLVALIIFAGFILFSIVPQLYQESLETELFIYILAYLRAPHHYLPSTFGTLQYVVAANFLIASGISWLYWNKYQNKSKELGLNIALMSIFIFILCIGGYVFVEVFPSRLWTTAQTFRLLIVVKWFGLIFIGGAITKFIQEQKFSTAVFFLFSLLNPLFIGIAFLIHLAKERVEKAFPYLNRVFEFYILIFSFFFISLIYSSTSILYWLPILVTFIIIFSFAYYDKRLLLMILSTSVILVTLNIIGFNIPEERTFSDEFNTKLANGNLLSDLEYEEFGKAGKQVASYAQLNTPIDSIFLTPSYFGQFRIDADRAIVVDFQSFPFSDDGILEWHIRLKRCYGEPREKGFFAIDEFNENYKNIDDDKLDKLKTVYNVSHAVLFYETFTEKPVLFQNNKFKIVELN